MSTVMTGVRDQLDATIAANPLIPVVVIDDAADAVATGEALVAGGILSAEVTFRTPAAAEAIAKMTAVDGLTVGAGTVVNADQAKAAIDAGARFLVSPGTSESVARVASDNAIPYVPAGVTPTEIIRILDLGLDVVKFFPATVMGGLPALKAFSGPFPQVRFIATGGISAANLPDWISQPFIASVGGSWMVTRDMVREHRFDEITALSAEAIRIAKEARA